MKIDFKRMKLDILAIGAHPDDIELGCGATIAKEISNGKKVGVLDLTRGELGTRGSAEIRSAEAEKSAQILGLSMRRNLELPDGFFSNKSTAGSLKLLKYDCPIFVGRDFLILSKGKVC